MKKGHISRSEPQAWDLSIPMSEYAVVDDEGRATPEANGVVYGPKIVFGKSRCQWWGRRHGYGSLVVST
jgi:hypothetical protein